MPNLSVLLTIALSELNAPPSTAVETFEFCPPAASGHGTETAADIFQRGLLQARSGQHALAISAFCDAMAVDAQWRLDSLQAIRRSFVASGRSHGVSALLAELIRELVRTSKSMTGAAGRGPLRQATRRLEELKAIDPNRAGLGDLEALLGGTERRAKSQVHLFSRLRSVFGIFVLLGAALALSNNRRAIRPRVVLWGMGLQFFFALLIMRTSPGQWVFDRAKGAIEKLLSFTDAGVVLLFDNLFRGRDRLGVDGPVSVINGSTGDVIELGRIFAIHVLPTIIFFGALMGVLFHLGLIQLVVRAIAFVMQRSMGTSGPESLSAAGNIFVGQTEAPLVIKPYLPTMTRSELTAVMCGGFATVAGGVLAAYSQYGLDAGHLLAASVMSAPAALVVAKIIYPEVDSGSAGTTSFALERRSSNVIDAAATGASDGLRLAANVAAMVIAFVALIALLNSLIAFLGSFCGWPELSLGTIFGTIFYPLAWSMGVDLPDLANFGRLLGIKVSINEFVAFVELGALKNTMSERSFTIATYALTGFANFSSIGIQIGGISAFAPERRADLAALGLRAMIGGAIASWLTACVAGILL